MFLDEEDGDFSDSETIVDSDFNDVEISGDAHEALTIEGDDENLA